MLDVYSELEKSLIVNEQVVLATLVDHRGSSPQVDGAKAIISDNGLHWGTVGGGKLEMAIIDEAKKMLMDKKKTSFFTWNLKTDVKMTCGGEVSFFLETYGSSRFQVAVFGAGHVAQAFIPLLLKIDCFITCIDSRKEWLDKLPESNRLKTICCENPAEYISQLNSGSFVITMTQGHKFDLPILGAAYDRSEDFPYIGAIGSKQKALIVKNDLKAMGVSTENLDRLFCPIGLDFGKNMPEEIAFSIVGQLITQRDLLS